MSQLRTRQDVLLRRGTASDVEAIVALARAVLETGELPDISDEDLAEERNALLVHPGGAIVAELGGDVVGYIAPRLNDLEVAPTHRRRGIGTALLEAGLEFVRERGEPYLLLYVPDADTPGRRFAQARGFRHRATLHLMKRPADMACAAPSPADEFVIRPFVPGEDRAEVLVPLMNISFADHPTVVTWTVGEVGARLARPEFDPGLLALAIGPDERPLGFGWASVEDRDGSLVGDVRLIGVLPEARGRGMGRALLRWAILALQGRGVITIELSVVEANARALDLYLAHGFRQVRAWPQWSRDV